MHDAYQSESRVNSAGAPASTVTQEPQRRQFALLSISTLALLRAAVAPMSDSSFHDEHARSQTREAVAALEARTSAEVVVAVRRIAGHYRDTDYLVGFLLSLAALLVMLFAERPFRLAAFPAGVVLSFVAGALLSSAIAPLRRSLTLPSRKRAQVRTAARAAFVELGVGQTRSRTGILVFVAVFEREVEIVCDSGIDPAALGEDWGRAVAELQLALKPRPALGRFIAALRALAPPLELALPRADDDVNELPDEVAAG